MYVAQWKKPGSTFYCWILCHCSDTPKFVYLFIYHNFFFLLLCSWISSQEYFLLPLHVFSEPLWISYPSLLAYMTPIPTNMTTTVGLGVFLVGSFSAGGIFRKQCLNTYLKPVQYVFKMSRPQLHNELATQAESDFLDVPSSETSTTRIWNQISSRMEWKPCHHP